MTRKNVSTKSRREQHQLISPDFELSFLDEPIEKMPKKLNERIKLIEKELFRNATRGCAISAATYLKNFSLSKKEAYELGLNASKIGLESLKFLVFEAAKNGVDKDKIAELVKSFALKSVFPEGFFNTFPFEQEDKKKQKIGKKKNKSSQK